MAIFSNDERWAVINWTEMCSPPFPDGGTGIGDYDKLTLLGLPILNIAEGVPPMTNFIEFLVNDGRFNFKVMGI